MMMNRSHQIHRVLNRSMLLGALSSIAVLAGWTPNFSEQSKMFDAAAYAQDQPTAFTRYVRAAVEIERTRQRLLDQVKQLTGGNVPNNVCQPGNIAQLNEGVRGQVKQICDSFSAQAVQIVTRNGLSREEFNRYQKQAQQPSMRSQIEAEIRRLQLR